MAQTTSTDQVQKLREAYEAFGRGDLEAIRGQFSPDIVWHIGGHSSLSGDYKGIDAVFEFFGRIFTETDGTLKNDVHDILANDTHGIVLLTQSAERNGKKLSMQFVHVTHRDAESRVTESWYLPMDAQAVDEFWA
ncbi:MAG TPA: nuclear transport factor 2 family protein [Candidatus Dormibacteraeota bacterium]|jgi:ketosteroid isomerase-like protein